MGAVTNYWVFDWLSENQIASLEQAAAFLPKYRVLDSLQQCAANAVNRQSEAMLPTRTSIVAGGGLDLTGGGMVCPSPACLRRQVDRLLKHVWHYFDTVVADDVLTPLLTEEWHGSKRELTNEILAQLAPLLYLKEIGATDLVDFRPKTRCAEHWAENARLEGLGAVLDSKDELIQHLMQEAKFSRQLLKGQSFYAMEFIDAEVEARIPVGKMGERQARMHLANEAFAEYMVDLVADVSVAHEYDLPLGSAQAFAAQMLRLSGPTSVADVIFQLGLPVLEGLPAAELIAIRKAHIEYFENFRNALRRAATERLKLHPSHISMQLADEIRTDLIEPELAKIRATLASAEQLLAKKTAVSIFLGALATTCGILSGLPPTVAVSAGAAATLGGVGPAASRHLDIQSELALGDMYFLWKAVGHSHTS